MKIRELREARGMTQAELARAVKVAKPTVCMWESGARRPDLGHFLALADVLGCSTDVLLGRKNRAERKEIVYDQ